MGHSTNTQSNTRRSNPFKRKVILVLVGSFLFVAIVATVWAAISLTSATIPDASEAVQGLEEKGLPIGEVETYNAGDDPNELLGRPGQYTSKSIFNDTRLDPDPISADFDVQNGGSVEVFENKGDAIRREEYLKGITRAVGPFAEYSYREGVVLLRLSHSLTPEQAKEYEAALKDLM